jgi:protein-S-isoprenylcysteine O-methyltransferase Ste14
MADNPGVRLPPPLLYAAVVFVGYLLNRRWPLHVGHHNVVQLFAWTLTFAWLALTIASIGKFWGARTSIVPIRPASALVISGPYRFTRNPMYVALALLTVAIGLFTDNWWPILLLVPALWVVAHLFIAPEERYLERRFGADYVRYAGRVRRWL